MKPYFYRPLLARLPLVLLLAAVGCGDTDGRTADESAEFQRVAVAPTEAGALPAAILGTAGPPQGLNVSYFPADSATRGYLSAPEGDGPFPALIIIHEWNGLVDRIRQTADALAAEGYVVLAADLYSGRIGTNRDENMALVQEVRGDEARVIANLDAAAGFLRARPDVSGKIAAMGWCFGGGIALSYALGGENHEGTAIFYGSLIDDPERLASINHEVYGTFGALDQGPSPELVNRFQSALRGAGVTNDIHIYDDVGHGFWLRVDEDPDVRTEPALDAWQRLKAYLGRVLS